MDKSVAVVHNGRLIYFHQTKASVKSESFSFSRPTDFCAELVSKSEITSKFHWEIEDVKITVDERSGLETPVILVSCDGESKSERSLCVIQMKWSGTLVTSHHINCGKTGSARTETGEDRPRKSEDLVPCVKFLCTIPLTKSSVCSLVYGPRILVANQNILSLLRLNLNGCNSKSQNTKSTVCKNEFSVCDTNESNSSEPTEQNGVENGLSRFDNHKEWDSVIVCVVSEENWIVAILQKKEVGGKHSTSLVTVALERHHENDEFSRNILRTGDFLPQEYAPKVSSINIHQCQRRETTKRISVYENLCIVGLNDGYVITLADGVLQTCVPLGTHIDAVYPVFCVTNVLPFDDNILICLTDRKQCFIVDGTANQVKHHWANVAQALVGDFLQCGGHQLLLLFGDRDVPYHHPNGYLLTNLQGFVADRRSDSADGSFSEDIFPAGNDEGARNLQPAVSAVLEQVQILSRKVGEERQKLASKQLFAEHMWHRLRQLSLQGPAVAAASEISPPEVPLVSLIGGHSSMALQPRPCGTPPERQEDVEVQLLWHRLLDSTCVVGVRILNTSDRELNHCVLTLAPSSCCQTTRHGDISATTRMWRSFGTNTQQWTAAPLPPQGNPCKRQKTHSRLSVSQTTAIQPAESVVVTAVFNISDLGWHGQLVYHVLLMYTVKECSSASASGRVDVGDVVPDANVAHRDVDQCGAGISGLGERPRTDSRSWKDSQRTRNAVCGKVVLKASELLQHRRGFERLMEDQEDGETDPAQLEEELLALSSVQRRWQCEVDLVLHEAAEVMGRCLRSAGLVFSERLGQHRMAGDIPTCLQWVRVQLVGYAPLPRRAASILVFARDVNQFLLLLRHLYSHLPDDATITLSAEDPALEIRNLVKRLSAQLSERKRQARRILEAQKSAPGPGSKSLTDTLNIGGESSASESACRTEEFGDWQRLYQQKQSGMVGKEEVATFKAAVVEHDMETDMAVAKVTL